MAENKSSFLGRILKAAAKDAEPEDLEELAKMKNDEPEKETQDEVPASAEHGGGDIEKKLDTLISMLTALAAKKEPEEDSTDELDELVKEDPAGDVENQEGEVETPPEELETKSYDSAREIASTVQKILKENIKDPKAYKQAAKDAAAQIRAAYGVQADNSGYKVFAQKTAEAGKKRAAADTRIPQEKIVEEQQNAYDKLNPHKNKEAK